MIVIIQPTINQAPQASLQRLQEASGGDTSEGSFRGASVTTTSGGIWKSFFFVEEAFFQEDLTVSNESGDTDLSEYPTLRRTDPEFVGGDVVMLHRGDWKKRLNLTYTTDTGSELKSVSGILEDDSYLRYSFDWLTGLLDTEGSPELYVSGVKNPACWAASEDLTGLSYSNSSGGGQKNSAPFTRRHMPGARHFPLAVGDTVTWPDGTTRTIIGASSPTGIPSDDSLVYALSGPDLPETVKVYPVAGRWLFITDDSGAIFSIGNQFCTLFVNQYRRVSFNVICYGEAKTQAKKSATIGGVAVTNAAVFVAFLGRAGEIPPEFASYTGYPSAVTGDSGSPLFVKVASGLALISAFASGENGWFFDEDFTNALIRSSNDDAVANGFTRPPDYTVTVAPDPTL